MHATQTAAQRYGKLLENTIADKILEIAETRDEFTTSDLQGIAQAEAVTIVKLCKEHQGLK